MENKNSKKKRHTTYRLIFGSDSYTIVCKKQIPSLNVFYLKQSLMFHKEKLQKKRVEKCDKA